MTHSRSPLLELDGSFHRTIVIGDIHGCFDEFLSLLAKVAFSADDALVAVGDIMDRGPLSQAVATFFRDTPNAFTVLGNHERRIAGTIRGTSQPAWSQRQTLSSIPHEERDGWAAWLEVLPAVITTPHVIITHARLDPSLALDMQDRKFCAGTGARIERDADGVPLWYQEWRESHADEKRPLAFGHLRHDRIELVPGLLYALDTDAVHGGPLTAVVFPEGTIVNVQCEDHYSRARESWKLLIQAEPERAKGRA